MNIKEYKGMKIVQCAQGDCEWFQARLGCLTASRVSDALKINTRGPRKGEGSAARDQYIVELVTERLRGTPIEHYVSPAMDYGIQNEPLARTAYEMANGCEVELNEAVPDTTYDGVEVERVGFVLHPTIPMSGASPDGLVNGDGLVEFKVPNSVTHVSYIESQAIPEEYQQQMNWQMACTGRKWCDFVSHDPRLPAGVNLFIKRLERDEKAIAAMEFAVIDFLAEVTKLQERLQGKRTLETDLRDSLKAREGYIGPPRAEIPVF